MFLLQNVIVALDTLLSVSVASMYNMITKLLYRSPLPTVSTPDVDVTIPDGPLYAGRTAPLTLICTISFNSATDTAISVTDMDITWLNGSTPLSNSTNRVTISPTLSGLQQPFTRNLTLSPLSTFDSTSFSCRARARPPANVQTLVTASEQGDGTISLTIERKPRY